MKAETRFSLKDQLFNPGSVARLSALLEAAHGGFPGERFQADVVRAFPELELKQRIAHITEMLHTYLAIPYQEAVGAILRALPPELDPARKDGDYGDFILAPLSLYVARYGCSAEHLTMSLEALREITKRFSAEGAIRYFLNAFPEQTLAFLRGCALDRHYHVRRLASEGTRPFLPWAMRLTIDPRAAMGILDLLHADPTRYVTRSVANHLNDLAKRDPDRVIVTLRRWREGGAQASDEMQWMTEHALRTLVKRGHPEALALLGFGAEARVEVVAISTDTPVVRVGGVFRFEVTLRVGERAGLLVDYVMRLAGGGRKVFKLKRVEVGAGESVTLVKGHPMRLMTTRALREGEHRVAVMVNGREVGEVGFELVG